jgi:hypothetical protein
MELCSKGCVACALQIACCHAARNMALLDKNRERTVQVGVPQALLDGKTMTLPADEQLQHARDCTPVASAALQSEFRVHGHFLRVKEPLGGFNGAASFGRDAASFGQHAADE